MKPGILVAVVGPSGAGKDSLIEAAKVHFSGNVAYCFTRRVITRPAAQAAEDHDTLTPEAFALAAGRGAFFLHWQAHGLHYGLPASLADSLRQGCVVVANISRTMIAEAVRIWPHTRVVLITAAPEILATRVAARARKFDGDVEQRVARKVAQPNTSLPCITIHNEGPLAEAATHFCATLEQIRSASDEGAVQPC